MTVCHFVAGSDSGFLFICYLQKLLEFDYGESDEEDDKKEGNVQQSVAHPPAVQVDSTTGLLG